MFVTLNKILADGHLRCNGWGSEGLPRPVQRERRLVWDSKAAKLAKIALPRFNAKRLLTFSIVYTFFYANKNIYNLINSH